MTEIERIVDQLRRAFEGPAWHGPSVREALESVDPAIAAHRAVAQAHTIWEIVEHIAAWEDIVRRRLEGEAMPSETPPDQDWPPVRDVSEDAWQRTLSRLRTGHERLRRTVATFPENRLDELRPSGESWYVLIQGAVQHDLYHAGQIAILAKAK